MPSALEEHAQELEQLALVLARTGADKLPDWTDIFYERCYGNEDSGVARTIVRNNKTREDIRPHSELNDIMATLKELRGKLPGEKWRCLSMHVTRSGEVDVQYDYDANCIDRFFDDYEAHRPF